MVVTGRVIDNQVRRIAYSLRVHGSNVRERYSHHGHKSEASPVSGEHPSNVVSQSGPHPWLREGRNDETISASLCILAQHHPASAWTGHFAGVLVPVLVSCFCPTLTCIYAHNCLGCECVAVDWKEVPTG